MGTICGTLKRILCCWGQRVQGGVITQVHWLTQMATINIRSRGLRGVRCTSACCQLCRSRREVHLPRQLLSWSTCLQLPLLTQRQLPSGSAFIQRLLEPCRSSAGSHELVGGPFSSLQRYAAPALVVGGIAPALRSSSARRGRHRSIYTAHLSACTCSLRLRCTQHVHQSWSTLHQRLEFCRASSCGVYCFCACRGVRFFSSSSERVDLMVANKFRARIWRPDIVVPKKFCARLWPSHMVATKLFPFPPRAHWPVYLSLECGQVRYTFGKVCGLKARVVKKNWLRNVCVWQLPSSKSFSVCVCVFSCSEYRSTESV